MGAPVVVVFLVIIGEAILLNNAVLVLNVRLRGYERRNLEREKEINVFVRAMQRSL